MALPNPGVTRHGNEAKRPIGAIGLGEVPGQKWILLELEAGAVDQCGAEEDQRLKGNGGRQLEQSLLSTMPGASIRRKTVFIYPLLVFGHRGRRGTDPAVPGAQAASHHAATTET